MGDEQTQESVEGGIWALVSSGTRAYLGRLKDFSTKETAERAFDNKKALVLCPVYDSFSPLRPVQREPGGPVGMARDPIITPFEFTTGKTTVRIHADVICFFDDMSPADKATYRGFVDAAEAALLQRRAEASGLTLAGPGPLPPHRHQRQ